MHGGKQKYPVIQALETVIRIEPPDARGDRLAAGRNASRKDYDAVVPSVFAELTWEAMAALGSIASTFILLIGAIAAVVQIRHLRRANQLESYLQLMHEFNSSEMLEARAFVESTDFTDPEVLYAATHPQLDARIRRVANHFQVVARLLNLGLLDERLFLAHFDVAAGTWKALRPVVYAARENTGKPLLIDVEYLVYRAAVDRTIAKAVARYPKAFLDRNNLRSLAERSQAVATAASRIASEEEPA